MTENERLMEMEREQIRQEIAEKNRAYRRRYMKEWRAKNKDKVKAGQERYIIRKTERLKAENNEF